MKTLLYYFSGTGNSLAAAKKVAAALGDTELVPLALLEDKDEIRPDAGRTGIICPVYFTGIPSMVAGFAERLRLMEESYVFAVVTFGGSGASPALHQLDTILRKQNGRGLDAGYSVKMPGNYILMYEAPAGNQRLEILAAADDAIAAIAAEVRECHRHALPRSFLAQVVHALLYPRFLGGVHEKDRNFTVSAACTSCGTCVEVCPAENIRLAEGRPVWLHRCELCCACIHACPALAIQSGKGTVQRQRYRNPEIAVTELNVRRGASP